LFLKSFLKFYLKFIFQHSFSASKFGATDFVNPNELPEGKTMVEFMREKYNGGVDFAFEATGNPTAMVGENISSGDLILKKNFKPGKPKELLLNFKNKIK
jgi:hypothetical protein